MNSARLLVVLLVLSGCGVTDRLDPRAIKQCAALHPPPPQANAERLGLIPVMATRTAASDDPAVRQWFADMDACTNKYQQTKAR